MTNDIIIKNLVKVFKKHHSEVRAVDGVSFEIKEGELFGLLGPNGAGKTTLIKCISTLLIPDKGTAIVGGCDVLKDPLGVRKKIGVLTGGERTLYWKLNAVDNLKYFAALYGVPSNRVKERIDFLLELMDLKERANENVEKFSSGMKQKLAIARALIHNPPILLIDEPTLGLDPYFARFIRRFIKEELSIKLKKTILLTTHYMDEADELCDRVAFMNRGRVEALDTPEKLKKAMPQEQVLELKCLGDLNKEDFVQLKESVSLNISKQDGYHYLRFNTDNPEVLLSKLVDMIRDRAKILSVQVTSPTLEDVFVYLTGTSLKESQDE
uniref:ABC transporter ATP-binding protein n=1 Tax=candidate division WOR-3 bacterium TaxID=2052148 RepID=A0A7V0Z4S3_UNCW3